MHGPLVHSRFEGHFLRDDLAVEGDPWSDLRRDRKHESYTQYELYGTPYMLGESS